MTDNTAVSTQHTPDSLPWVALKRTIQPPPNEIAHWAIEDRWGHEVGASTVGQHAFNTANAEYIVKACNLFPELLSALERTLKVLETTRLVLHGDLCQQWADCVDACVEAQEIRKSARAALAKARA